MVCMLTYKRLREVLIYNDVTGEFIWRVPRPKVRVGARAGYHHYRGYRAIEVDGHAYAEHRLAWFYMKKRWPPQQIDHKDRNRANNRWINLRSAKNGQNRANSKTTNKHGLKGVRLCSWMTKKPWQAQITFRKKVRYLGCYTTKEAAHAAYCRAARKLHGEFFAEGV